MDIGVTLLMAGSAVGVVVAAVFGLQSWQEQRPIPQTIDWPPSLEELITARAEQMAEQAAIEQAGKRHRHDIHCAKCGRFAKVVPGLPGVGDCRYHGMTIRVSNAKSVTLDLRILQPSGKINS